MLFCYCLWIATCNCLGSADCWALPRLVDYLYPTKLTHWLISYDSLGPSELHNDPTFLVRRNNFLFLLSSVDTFNFRLPSHYFDDVRADAVVRQRASTGVVQLRRSWPRSLPTYQGRRCCFHLLLHPRTQSVRVGDIHPLPDASPAPTAVIPAGFWNTPPKPGPPPSSQVGNSP